MTKPKKRRGRPPRQQAPPPPPEPQAPAPPEDLESQPGPQFPDPEEPRPDQPPPPPANPGQESEPGKEPEPDKEPEPEAEGKVTEKDSKKKCKESPPPPDPGTKGAVPGPRVRVKATEKTASKTELADLTRSMVEMLKKEFPDHHATLGSKAGKIYQVNECISTGLLNLDPILGCDVFGVWGMPFGRQTEISGPETTGKTTLLLHIARQIALMGGLVKYYEMENNLDLRYAHKFVPPDQFVLSQPDTIEGVFNSMIEVIQYHLAWNKKHKREVPLGLFWDTVAASSTEAEFGSDMEQANPGIHARKVSQGERKLVRMPAGERVMLIFTNQVAEDFGGMPGGYMGKKYKSAIANLRFAHYATLRLEMRSHGNIKIGNDEYSEVVGKKIFVTTKKNKVGGVPERQAELRLLHTKEFSEGFSMIQAMLDLHLISKVGVAFTFEFDPFKGECFEDDIWNTEFSKIIEDPEIKKLMIDTIRKKQSEVFRALTLEGRT